MIPQENKNSIEKVSSEVTSSEFTISADASMFAMLTANVYTDPIKAVIREWSTNACDVCLEAEVPVKFDVHLPVAGDSVFSVRDYGTGLPPDVLTGLFTVLGASTKRNSNVTNGTLGIGRLAGLAVADAFTVESFLDGTHYSYVVSMVEGKPTIMHLGDFATQEPNGLKLSVTVDIQKIQTYQETAENVYQYFKYKPTVNLDITTKLEKIGPCTDNWFITKNAIHYGNDNNYIVMSQVAYAIPNNNAINARGLRNIVFIANPGDVTFNPGRETLSLDLRTINKVNTIFETVATEIITITQQSLALCSNDVELYKCYAAAQTALPRSILANIHLSCLGSKQLQYLVKSDGYNSFLRASPEFIEQTENTLKLLYKFRYHKRFKNAFDANIDMEKLFVTDHIIVDVKTKFLDGLQALYKNRNVFLWRCDSNKHIEKSVTHAKKYLTAMGLTYQLASNILPKNISTASQKLSREGVYASRITGPNILRSEKLDSSDLTTDTYLYVKLSNTTPLLNSTILDFTDYWQLYAALARIAPMPAVRGIAKKYQSYVNTLDNWIDFETYVEEKIKESSFQIESNHPEYFQRAYFDKDSIKNYPEIVQKQYENIVKYLNYQEADNYVSCKVKTLMEKVGTTFIPYVSPHQSQITTLKNNYPLTFDLLFNKKTRVFSNYSELTTAQVQHIAELEEFYAVHSNKS